jgi:hypothetical protein
VKDAPWDSSSVVIESSFWLQGWGEPAYRS